jgi:hypothetical protein
MGLQMPYFYTQKGTKMDNNTNTPDTLTNMITLLEEVRTDYNKFYVDGNASAGTRVRKVMQQIKTDAHAVRTHVQSTKNGG